MQSTRCRSSQQNQHTAGLDPLKQAGFVDVDKYSGLLVTLQNWVAAAAEISAFAVLLFGKTRTGVRAEPDLAARQHNIKLGGWFIQAKRIQLNTFQTYSFNNAQTANPASSSRFISGVGLLGFPNSVAAQLPTLHGGPVQFKYAGWPVMFRTNGN